MTRNQPSSSDFSLQMKKAFKRLESGISELNDLISKETRFPVIRSFVFEGEVDLIII